MTKFKASELVKFCNSIVNEGYVWGASGQVFTESVAIKLHATYHTTIYNKKYYLETQMKRWKGKRVFDCSGVAQSFRGTDDSAHGLYTKCPIKGELSKCDYQPGTLIFCMKDGKVNHVGYIVEDGFVVHATSSEKGIVKEKVNLSRGWSHFGKPDWLEYDMPAKPTFDLPLWMKKVQAIIMCRKGDNTELVGLLQERLKSLGYDVGTIDKDFGTKTELQLKEYQSDKKITATGICDCTTWQALFKV